jgi:hypothetical protein
MRNHLLLLNSLYNFSYAETCPYYLFINRCWYDPLQVVIWTEY